MPTIARFDGVSICMYVDDEHFPHCHARHAGREMLVDIEALEIAAGRLEPAAQRKALAWCRDNQAC